LTSPRFPRDERRAALIVIPTVARPKVLLPAFARLLEHLDGLPVHICVSINAVNQTDGDTSQREVVKLWQSYCAEGIVPGGSLLTVYRHPGPCGFGGALNRGVLAAADGFNVRVGLINPGDSIVSPIMDSRWPEDMIQTVSAGGLIRYDDGGGVSFEGVDKDHGPGLPPLIIFYNDDLEAADGWLAELVAATRPDQTTICDICEPAPDGKRQPRPLALYGKIGIVGPVTNNAAGMQGLVREVRDWQRLGSDAFAAQWRRSNAGTVLTADFLSGFCLGITADCLEALWGAHPERDGYGLFDEATYPIAGYEDNDLCVRSAEAGYRAAICAGSFVGHIGHQSFDALFPEMQRGLRNRLNYYRKWAPWVRARAGKLVAALRVKIEVPNDLRLLRPTLQRLGELVDSVAILFTNDPSDALAHSEGQIEVKTGELPQDDLALLRSLAHPNLRGNPQRRADRIQQWLKARVTEGATQRGRKAPTVGVSFWPTDRPMNERDERNAVIGMAERLGASWVWSIDHDEVVEPRITRAHLDRWMTHPDPLVSCLDQGFYTTWDTVRMYRLDLPWGDGGQMTGGMRGWRLWRVNRAAPGRILAGTENGLHCGNSPTGDPMTKRHAAIRILHHGYLREADRVRKQARYQVQDPNPDPLLVGGSNYNHLTYEERVTLARFVPRCGIGLHMLVHAGEDSGGVMGVLDQLHGLTDAAVLVWTDAPDAPERQTMAEVADLFGAVLVDHPIDQERGGLADARNAGIDALAEIEATRHPGMGWSLFMDPDEQFAEGAMVSIRRLADATDCWGWLFEFLNPHQEGAPTRSESVRMARLHPRMRMDGRVHEGFGDAIRALKAAGYGDILRTAPFQVLNLGLRVDATKLQAKYDRYFRWACAAISEGEARPMDWTTLGLYFANEGLWQAPERCHAIATGMDPDGFLAARELAVHYLRMARGPAALAASRLPDWHEQHERLDAIVKFCDREAPPISGSGLAGAPNRKGWTEEAALGVINLLVDVSAARAAGASVIVAEPDGEVEDPPDPERGDGESERDYLIRTMEDRGVSDVEIHDVLDRYDYANPVSVEEDDGDPE